jgi:hypothetical protein
MQIGMQNDVFSLPEGTAQNPASPRKWSIRNSSYKSRARLILFTHHAKPSASIDFQSYNGLHSKFNKGNTVQNFLKSQEIYGYWYTTEKELGKSK